jgi:hypothetical protein
MLIIGTNNRTTPIQTATPAEATTEGDPEIKIPIKMP